MKRPDLKKGLRRGIYVIPTSFTILNLFFGFRCIVYSTHEEQKRGAMEAGAYDFIKKGELADLRDSLERLMGLERG